MRAPNPRSQIATGFTVEADPMPITRPSGVSPEGDPYSVNQDDNTRRSR